MPIEDMSPKHSKELATINQVHCPIACISSIKSVHALQHVESAQALRRNSTRKLCAEKRS